MMTDKERDIERFNESIKQFQDDINELKVDLYAVRSKKVVKYIGDEIKRLERFKERKEFELWKLEREEL